jgi:hypothetical protein
MNMNDSGPKSGPTTAASTCLLLVGDRVVLRATAPPEAEYAMFDLGEIELRASEPGRVREHGYQTTATLARSRLAALGITPTLARDVALTMQPVLSDAYARGSAVRRVARYLGPAELFQSEAYNGDRRAYRGVFLDLGALGRDLELEGAGATLHALYLATVLEHEPDATTILLSTDACTKGGKPGARTYRRVGLSEPQQLLNAIGKLAHLAPQPEIEEALPRADVIAFLRERADAAPDDDARALYKSLETSVSLREMPERGPLAAAHLWAIEMRIESGDLTGVPEAIDQAEQRHGRTPGTTYLRARASLALHLEPPKLIAERVSALALSMTSFQELGLLAAEAWLDAGDPRRAMPYARDLVDASSVDEVILLRAQRLLARAVGAAPHRKHETLVDTMPVAPQPSRPPGAYRAVSTAPPVSLELDEVGSSPASAGAVTESRRPPGATGPLPPPMPPPIRVTPAVTPAVPSSRPSPAAGSTPPSSPSRLPPASPVPRLARRPTPITLDGAPDAAPATSPSPADTAASFTLDLPGPESSSRSASAAPERRTSSAPARPRISGVMMETRPPSSADPRAEPDSPMFPRHPTPRLETASSPRSVAPSSGPPSPRARRSTSPEIEERLKSSSDHRPVSIAKLDTPLEMAPATTTPTPAPPPAGAATPFMHGASMPPYRLESPAPRLSRAPLLPKVASGGDELAEHLALPPGVGVDVKSRGGLPTSVLEARVQFTLLARELGLDYRLKRGIQLVADVAGIEAMQAVLLESFPERVVRSEDDAYELRRHGALLSEILARRLDAEWLDISPSELGYWAMIIPPDTRVWPFGRVSRLVSMGHKERDLVSYFLELQTRTRSR